MCIIGVRMIGYRNITNFNINQSDDLALFIASCTCMLF